MEKKFFIDKNFNIRETKSIDKSGKTDKIKKNKTYPLYLNLGFYLLTPILLGVFLGYNLDKRLGTKNFFILLGIFVGALGTFYNLYRLLK